METLSSMLRAAVVGLFLITFLVEPCRIPSRSMVPTLLVGDFLLVDRQAHAPAGKWNWLLPYREAKRGDIQVFYAPTPNHTLLVKRVIATEGDTLSMRAGQVVLNGIPQTEPYAVYAPASRNRFRDDFPNMQEADPDAEAAWWVEMRSRVHDGSITVPPHRLFMMGDNRNESQDSRYWGFAHEDSLLGQPILISLSFQSPDENESPLQRVEHFVRWRRLLHTPH